MATIMIVDDASIVRKSLSGMLEKHGHVVAAEAGSCDEALKNYKLHRVDLVTMDIQLPDQSGVECVRLIRQYDPDAKIVMVSAVEQKQLIYEAIKNGAKHYIIKPFTESKVIETVAVVLAEP